MVRLCAFCKRLLTRPFGLPSLVEWMDVQKYKTPLLKLVFKNLAYHTEMVTLTLLHERQGGHDPCGPPRKRDAASQGVILQTIHFNFNEDHHLWVNVVAYCTKYFHLITKISLTVYTVSKSHRLDVTARGSNSDPLIHHWSTAKQLHESKGKQTLGDSSIIEWISWPSILHSKWVMFQKTKQQFTNSVKNKSTLAKRKHKWH